jgi:hypothetical protein
LTLTTAADRFGTRSVESEADDEAAPAALKKLGQGDTPTFSTVSRPKATLIPEPIPRQHSWSAKPN